MPDACSDLTLRDLGKMIDEVGKNETAATELLANPKAFFKSRGFSVPRGATVRTQPLKDLHAAMDKPGGSRRIFTNARTVVGHIPKGRARCTTIVVK
jgi:hypothetical protein